MHSLTYMPLLRGKENELRLLEVISPLIQIAPIVPVIEPVSANTAKLERVINYYANFQIPLGVIVNPSVGDFSESSEHLLMRIENLLHRTPSVFPVIRAGHKGDIPWGRLEKSEKLALIEGGPASHQIKSELLSDPSRVSYRIVDSRVASEPQGQPTSNLILLSDGFEHRRNVDYPEDEAFDAGPGRRDLEGASGWGDYSVVGQHYQTGGGLPHAVAIHITYWVPGHGLRVHHYLSDTNDGPENTAGKFGEAINKLVADLDRHTYPILETPAIKEFRDLHSRRHFPGLGVVKLLSMRHHLETISECTTPTA